MPFDMYGAQKAAIAKTAADREFTRKLAAAGAVGLFALADQMAAAGNASESRQAMRALVSRFPAHPLASLAAERLAVLSK